MSRLTGNDDNSLRLSRLEMDRTRKRQQMESLLLQKFEIERSMEELARQLESLDDEIDLLEQQQVAAAVNHDETQLTPITTTTTTTRQRSAVFTQPTQADEILTDPRCCSRNDVQNNKKNIQDSTIRPTRQQQQQPTDLHDHVVAAPTNKDEYDDDIEYLTEPMTMQNTANDSPLRPLESEQTMKATTTTALISNNKNQHLVLQPLPSIMNNNIPNQDDSTKLPTTTATSGTTTRSSFDDYFGVHTNQNHKKKTPPNGIVTSTTHPAAESETSIFVTKLLQETFRIAAFREHQREIVLATLAGHDVFVIMRTGGGKSLTYQLPAVLEGRYSPHKKITLVVSPLLSLIQDQEEQMNQFCPGTAVSFTSGMGVSEHAQRWNRVRDPNAGVCLVLVTPEKISKSNKLCAELEKLNLAGRLGRFVIDEAHWYVPFLENKTKRQPILFVLIYGMASLFLDFFKIHYYY